MLTSCIAFCQITASAKGLAVINFCHPTQAPSFFMVTVEIIRFELYSADFTLEASALKNRQLLSRCKQASLYHSSASAPLLLPELSDPLPTLIT